MSSLHPSQLSHTFRPVDKQQILPLIKLQAAGGVGGSPHAVNEVILLQASASYFAIEPILRSLTACTTLGAVEKYIVDSSPAHVGVTGEEGSQVVVAPPSYLDNEGYGGAAAAVRFDLWTPLRSQDKVGKLPEAEKQR